MEKMHYTEYLETIRPEEEEIGVTVQVPYVSDKNPEWPIHIIIRAGNKILMFTLYEFGQVCDTVREALKDAGWVEEKPFWGTPKGDG